MTPKIFLPALVGAAIFTGCSNLTEQPPQRDLQALFAKADTDGDGRVSRDEFADFMVGEVFTNYDRNGDGTVTLEEFVAGGGTPENFRKINRSGTGRITLAEARASSLVRETMITPFDEADTDGSGYVTWEEFQQFRARAQPYIR